MCVAMFEITAWVYVRIGDSVAITRDIRNGKIRV